MPKSTGSFHWPHQRKGGRPFEPGVAPNPKGRPKGARHRLGTKFLQDVLDHWEVHGVQAIIDLRKESVREYVKMVATLLPREVNLKVSEFDELSDEQVAAMLTATIAELHAAEEAEAAAAEVPSVQ
jgi:hypothetical protein